MSSTKLYVLTAPTPRSGGTYAFYGLDDHSTILQCMIKSGKTKTAADIVPKITRHSFLLLKNATLNAMGHTTYVNVFPDNTKVFKTSRFDYDANVEHTFFNPPQKSIPEALASPKKKRLTIEGRVVKIGEVVTGPNDAWKRREISVSDTETSAVIPCKLWGDRAGEITEADTNATVTLTNVEVDVWKGTTQLKTTDLSSITVQQPQQQPAQHVIDGIDIEEQHVNFITTTGREFHVPKDLLTVEAEELVDTVPFTATIVIGNNDTVTALTIAEA